MALKTMVKEIALTEDTQIIFGAYIDVISYVKGYHVYKNVWVPRLQEQVHGEIEPNNHVDQYAVLLKKWKNSWASTIKENWKICKNNFFSFEQIRTESAI